MRGHQKSSPNLRFLKPTCQQPNYLFGTNPLTSRNDIQKPTRLQQSEISLTAEKTQLSHKYQLHSSRMVTISNLKTSKLLKQTYFQKTEPNETFEKQKQQLPSQQHSYDYINIFNRKKTAEQILYRPITSHIKQQNSDNQFKMESPRQKINQNNIVQQEFTSVYYLTDLIKSFDNKENYFTKLFKDHLSASHMALKQCGTGKIIYKPKFISLPKDPKDSKKYTILFDLDETLIHCTLDLRLPADKKLTIKMNQDEYLQVGLNVRPGLQTMLELLSPNFEIIVFTASHGQYAKKIVEVIDPKRIISKVLSREHCCFTDLGQYVKDISIIKNRSLAKIVLVDNSASSYYYQLDNGIPIVPFFDNKLDKQLYSLTKYLNGMIGYDDVREYNKKYLKTHMMAKLNTEEEVLEIYKKHHQSLCCPKN